jgi:DNA-binding transcriptional regulator YiaG
MNSELIDNPTIVGSSPGTSAGGSLVKKSLRIIYIAGALSMPGTVGAGTPPGLNPDSVVQTNSGLTVAAVKTPGVAIMELRRLSGMTWDQLARLFGVTRRTVHFWASGKTLNASNEEKLRRVVATLLQIDRGNASANRDALFTSTADGVLPFDLLQAERYSEVVNQLGDTWHRQLTKLSPLSPEALSSRLPRNPGNLVNAMQEKVHRDSGKSRPASAIRIKGKSSGDEA